MYSNLKGFLDQYTRVVWVQFSNLKYIRNVWRVRDDGHLYDVTSKCCGVTITTRLVEWTLSIFEIRVFFCCFQELSGWGPRWGQKSLDLRSRDFCPHLEPRGELIVHYRPPMSFRYNMIWYDMLCCAVLCCAVLWCDVMWCDMITHARYDKVT